MSYGRRIKEHIGLQSRLFGRHFILFIKIICKNQVSLNNFDKSEMFKYKWKNKCNSLETVINNLLLIYSHV